MDEYNYSYKQIFEDIYGWAGQIRRSDFLRVLK